MRFAFILSLLLVAKVAYALDPDEKVLDPNARPTMRELYDDCQVHLNTSNNASFMKSDCGVFTQGIIAGSSMMGLEIELNDYEVTCGSSAEINLKHIKNPSTQFVEGSKIAAKKLMKFYEEFQSSLEDPDFKTRIDKIPAGYAFALMGYFSSERFNNCQISPKDHPQIIEVPTPQ